MVRVQSNDLHLQEAKRNVTVHLLFFKVTNLLQNWLNTPADMTDLVTKTLRPQNIVWRHLIFKFGLHRIFKVKVSTGSTKIC